MAHFNDGETIFKQGAAEGVMYKIKGGKVRIFRVQDGQETTLAILKPGEFFGEMALFDHEVRMATVRALGRARVLTVDKRNLMRRIHEDPSLAYRLVQTMSHRLRDLSTEVTRLNLQIEENAIHEC